MNAKVRRHAKKVSRRPTGKPARGVIYVRVSTEDQVAGTSLDDQERQCAAMLLQEDIELVRGFRDEGVSAKTAERAELVAALDFALDKRNRIDVFVVWKVDRLARNTEDHFAIRRLLREGGIDLRSVTEPIGDDPSSKLFEVMIAGFAEFDNSIRRLRCVNGMRARIRSGIWPFRAPPGYRNRALARRDVKKTDPDPVDPNVFPLLQGLLKGFAQGVYTQAEIVRQLEAADFEALAGAKPTPQFVDRLLSNYVRFYGGWLRDVFGDEVEYHRGRHEPMITEAEMYAIESMRAGGPRIAIPHSRIHAEFPLKGLLRCDACGQPLTASKARGRRAYYRYYHCFNRAVAHARPNLPKGDVESRFGAFIEQLRPRPNVMRALGASIAKYAMECRASAEALTQAHAKTLFDLEGRRAKILEMAETGMYEPRLARERLAFVEREIAEVRADQPVTMETHDAEKTVAQALLTIDHIISGWFQLDADIRERFEKIAFPEGISVSANLEFSNRKPSLVFALNSSFDTRKSDKVDLDGVGSNRLLGELNEIVGLGAWVEERGAPRAKSPTSPTSPLSLATQH